MCLPDQLHGHLASIGQTVADGQFNTDRSTDDIAVDIASVLRQFWRQTTYIKQYAVWRTLFDALCIVYHRLSVPRVAAHNGSATTGYLCRQPARVCVMSSSLTTCRRRRSRSITLRHCKENVSALLLAHSLIAGLL